MRCTFLLAVLALPLAAQDSRFDVHSRLVLVPVNVTDAKGRSVDDLEAADFRLLDNQRERKVAVDTIATGVAPIALVVAVQSSGISAPVLEKVRKIAGMIQPLITGEQGCAALLSFAESITWLQDCTSDADTLGRSFQQIQSGSEAKEARMLDAVDEAIVRLSKRANARRVLLLVSESRDRGSETVLEEVAVAAQTANVTVYSATYSALKTAFTSKARVGEPQRPQQPQTGPEAMRTVNGQPPSKYNPENTPPAQRADLAGALAELAHLSKAKATQVLAELTGGTTFPFTRQKGLEDAIEKLGAELHTQYVLSFPPDSAAPGYHRLEVQLVRSGEFHIRARPGYWSSEAR